MEKFDWRQRYSKGAKSPAVEVSPTTSTTSGLARSSWVVASAGSSTDGRSVGQKSARSSAIGSK